MIDLDYRKEWREPCVIGPRGHLTNHHWIDENTIGERVKPEEATHFTVTMVTVEEATSGER
jgi:hypothetical protein